MNKTRFKRPVFPALKLMETSQNNNIISPALGSEHEKLDGPFENI